MDNPNSVANNDDPFFDSQTEFPSESQLYTPVKSDVIISPSSFRRRHSFLHSPGNISRFARSLLENAMKTENSSEAVLKSKQNDDELIEVRNDFSAGSLIKAITFPFRLLYKVSVFPVKTLYFWYMLVIDPFGVIRRAREYVIRKIFTYMYEYMKQHNRFWKLGLWFARATLWSIYVSFFLVCLVITSVVVTGFMMKFLVVKPIQMKEKLVFDYRKSSPVAFVPLLSCKTADCGEKCSIELGKLGRRRIIPSNNNFQVSVSLKLPESDYNRNLGIFQVRVDCLSIKGETIESSSYPSMLQYKSQPVRLMLTFVKLIPLLTDYFSESQTLNVNFDAVKEGKTPTACLKVTVENRAEFPPGSGVPEIYDGFLTLESDLPLLKRVLWSWKKIIFILLSFMVFSTEFLFVLLFLRPLLLPSLRPKIF